MLFLKVTKSVKQFGARFGWLIAELIFVFLGLYGAFLLERMHDDEMDLLRKKQILQALVDEFENYEDELSSASHSLDEGYGIPFFTAYSSGEKPFPSPIPFGGMGSVNTGIWEAMLQSGGIEVLEVGMIQEVQGFFKKLQDLLDLYSRFERLSESMILPQMDQPVEFFYEPDSTELRNKYKWYVNSLFTVGMSLRELSQLASSTKKLLSQEFEDTVGDVSVDYFYEDKNESTNHQTLEGQNSLSTASQATVSDSDSKISESLFNRFIKESIELLNEISDVSPTFDENYAVPFFSSYAEGNQPAPFVVTMEILPMKLSDRMKICLENLEDDRFTNRENFHFCKTYFINFIEFHHSFKLFSEKTKNEFSSSKISPVQYYDTNSTQLKDKFEWFANELYSFGTNLRSISEESQQILTELQAKVDK